jgi:hypothetical protein
MADPQVKTLSYRVKHSDQIDYAKASALSYKERDFTVAIEGDKATVKMIAHHATRHSARAVVEPRLEAWELNALLALGVDQTFAPLRVTRTAKIAKWHHKHQPEIG